MVPRLFSTNFVYEFFFGLRTSIRVPLTTGGVKILKIGQPILNAKAKKRSYMKSVENNLGALYIQLQTILICFRVLLYLFQLKIQYFEIFGGLFAPPHAFRYKTKTEMQISQAVVGIFTFCKNWGKEEGLLYPKLQ